MLRRLWETGDFIIIAAADFEEVPALQRSILCTEMLPKGAVAKQQPLILCIKCHCGGDQVQDGFAIIQFCFHRCDLFPYMNA